MSLSTLAGTKWLINLEPNLNALYCEINFISNKTEYSNFEIYNPPSIEIDYGDDLLSFPVYTSNGWDNSSYRTIEIIDGDDVTNSSLISWLENNAVQIIGTHEVNIAYGSLSIATLDGSGSTTLLTSGKQCNNDIVIEYTRPSALLQSKSVTPITSAQTIIPDSDYDGLSQVSVSAIPSYYGNTRTDTAAAADLLASKKAHTYSNGAAVQITGTMINRGTISKTLDTTSGNQSYTIPSGKHSGSGTVSITLEEKSATPSELSQTITPTSGKVLSKVNVGAISSTYVGSGVTKKTAQTYTPGTIDYTIAANQYLTGAQTISGDTNLIPENIADGVSIFGVIGTHSGGLPTYIHHAVIIPEEDTRSFSLTIGTGIRLVVFTSNHDASTAPKATTVIGGNIAIQANGNFYPSGCRLNCLNTSNNSTYYTTNSSGSQSWSYSNGVLSISNGTGWKLKGGTRYDFFWA